MSFRTVVVAVRLMGALALVAGCSPIVSRTPVRGAPQSVARLAGTWEGEYSSDESGRSGTIVFRLRAGADTAEGDVVMGPRGESRASAPETGAVMPHALGSPQLLTIKFVAVSGDVVSGVLDPYRDPACGCTLTTTFRGTLRGDAIEGTFVSEGTGIHHVPQSGRWRVTRVR